jgi:cell division ATPase FtsA
MNDSSERLKQRSMLLAVGVVSSGVVMINTLPGDMRALGVTVIAIGGGLFLLHLRKYRG